MKNVQITVIIAALCICRLGHSQAQTDIQVLRARYGFGTQQMDVTAQVQSLLQSGQRDMRVGNHLFGNDPAFGKVKTLSMLVSSGGQQFQINIREGDQLSLAVTDALPMAASAQTAVSPIAPRLAPDGMCYLIGSTSVVKNGALIGLHAGTPLKILRDNVSNLSVSWEGVEFDVDTRIISNDLNVVEAAVAADHRGQEAFRKQKEESQRKQADEKNKYWIEREKEEPKQAGAASSENRDNLPSNPSYDDVVRQMIQSSQYHGNPLDRRAYNQIGPNPPNNETQRMIESLQPQPSNPLDRGAYNKRATFGSPKPSSASPLQRQIEILDSKIRSTESMRHQATNLTRQQIDAKVEALKAERDTLYQLERIERERQEKKN